MKSDKDLPQGKKSEIKKKGKKEEIKEERAETEKNNLETTEPTQNDGVIEDWGNLKSRVSQKKIAKNETEGSSLFSDIKKLESRIRNNSMKKNNEKIEE